MAAGCASQVRLWLRCVSGLNSTRACYADASGYASNIACSYGAIGVAP